jgi:hypothetical protein
VQALGGARNAALARDREQEAELVEGEAHGRRAGWVVYIDKSLFEKQK